MARFAKHYKCPYGQQGDFLWVREKWRVLRHPTKGAPFAILRSAAGDGDWTATPGGRLSRRDVWRPSIHMPRWASRTLLVVAREPLHAIEEPGAIAEGVRSIEEFRCLWDEINGARGYGWDTNPPGVGGTLPGSEGAVMRSARVRGLLVWTWLPLVGVVCAFLWLTCHMWSLKQAAANLETERDALREEVGELRAQHVRSPGARGTRPGSSSTGGLRTWRATTRIR